MKRPILLLTFLLLLSATAWAQSEDCQDLKEENKRLRERITKLRAKVPNDEELPEAEGDYKRDEISRASNRKTHGEIIFKVQIGYFKDRDLKRYFNNNPMFGGEVDADGGQKYTLGYFSDYWEADQFKKYLRAMGVKDAWIVSYKDGKRVPIKDVLEGNIY